VSDATASKVAAYCDAAGMDAKDPLRLAMVSVAQSAEALSFSAEKVGKEAGQRAAQAAAAEMRAVAPKVLREAVWAKWLTVGGLVILSVVAGWLVGRHTPLQTGFGRLTPAQVETLRWNDLGTLLNGCQAQPPTSGREWCGFTGGWWLGPPAAPK
jgi:hypothetical protein